MAKLTTLDKFGEEIEHIEIDCSINDFLRDKCPDFVEGYYPFTATLNDKPFNDFDRNLEEGDIVKVTLEPKGLVAVGLGLLGILTAGYTYYTLKNLDVPDQNYQSASTRGESIYSSNARVNQVKPSQNIREVSGTVDIYPDYIVEPFRDVDGDKEALNIFASVGAGYFDFDQSNVFIGETPIDNYEGSFKLNINEPGDNTSSSRKRICQNWYKSKEVSQIQLTGGDRDEARQRFETSGTDGIYCKDYRNGNTLDFPFKVDDVFQFERSNEGDGSDLNARTFRVQSIDATQKATLLEVTKEVGAVRATLSTASKLRLKYKLPKQYRIPIQMAGGVNPSFSGSESEIVSAVNINSGVNWYGPYITTPEGEKTQYLELDFRFRNGLYQIDDEGEYASAGVAVEIRWRDYGQTVWNYEPLYAYSGRSPDEAGFIERISFDTKIRPEIEIRRFTADSEDTTVSDDIEVSNVKTLLETPGSYPDITTIEVSLQTDEEISRTAENLISIRGATRKLPTLSEIQSGSWDLRDESTKVNSEYDYTLTKFFRSINLSIGGVRGGGEYNPTVTGEPVIDFSNDGKYALTVTNKGFLTLYKLGFPYVFTQRRVLQTITINWPDNIPSNNNDVIARFANDPNNKLLMISEAYQQGGTTFSKASLYDIVRNEFVPGARLPSLLGDGTRDFYSRPDGFEFFYISTDGTAILSYENNSVPYNYSDANQGQLANIPSGATAITSFDFKPDGTKYYTIADGEFYQYTLTTPFDLSTASLDFKDDQYLSQNPQYVRANPNSLMLTEVENDIGVLNQYLRGRNFDNRATRNPIRFVAYALWQAMGSSVVDRVDWQAMQELETLLDTREDYLDAEFVEESTLWDVIKRALAVGYCEPTVIDGKFTPVRISQGTDYKQLYTPDHMKNDVVFQQAFFDEQESDGVVVEYLDSTSGSTQTVECRIGNDAGERPTRLNAIGITDRNKAWRLGMRLRNRDRYKPGTISFETELDALNSNYGDPIAVASYLWGSQVGTVKDYDSGTLTLTLDFAPIVKPGTNYIALKDVEGLTDFIEVAGTSGNQVFLSDAPVITPIFDDPEIDPTAVSFGPEEEIFKRAIVRAIEPAGETTVNVTAEEYLDEVYQSDDAIEGGLPFVVTNQKFDFQEFRPSQQVIGYVDIRELDSPDFNRVLLSTTSNVSPDGNLQVSTSDPGALSLTASGVNSDLNNSESGLNTFFYDVYIEYTDLTISEPITIELTVTDSQMPPEGSLFYHAFEEPEIKPTTAYYPDYANTAYDLNYGSPVVESANADGLFNYNYRLSKDTNSVFDDPQNNNMPDEFTSSTEGYFWFVVKRGEYASYFSADEDDSTQGTFSLRAEAAYLSNGDLRLTISVSLVDVNIVVFSYEKLIPAPAGDYTLVALGWDKSLDSGNGGYWGYTNTEGYFTNFTDNDVLNKKTWINEIYGTNRGRKQAYVPFMSANGSVASGYVEGKYDAEKMGRLLDFTLEGTALSGSTKIYTGQDVNWQFNGDDSKSSAASNEFISRLDSYFKTNFDSLTVGSSVPFSLSVGAFGNADFSGQGTVDNDLSGFPPYEATNFLLLNSSAPLVIDIDNPVTAFGFFVSQIGNWDANPTVTIENTVTGESKQFSIPYSTLFGGDLLFWGVTDFDNEFDRVSIKNNASSSIFPIVIYNIAVGLSAN